MPRRKPRGEAHVRLYGFEMKTPAWTTLDTDAKALLVEMRALFDAKRGDNVVFLSVREVMRRLGIGQRRSQAALSALVERGWIAVHEAGGFSRKARHATSYALENEPPNSGNGSVPRKSYMRWQPPTSDARSFTVAAAATDGSQDSYRGARKAPQKRPHGSQSSYRKAAFPR